MSVEERFAITEQVPRHLGASSAGWHPNIAERLSDGACAPRRRCNFLHFRDTPDTYTDSMTQFDATAHAMGAETHDLDGGVGA